MNEQEEHLNKFLTSSTYNQLSANQQKHAQDILTRFNHYMANEQQLADTAWTPQAVKEVMVGEFIADPALTNQFGIAVAPVLKAYQKYLAVDNYQEIAQAIDDQRTNMNACRKAHQTWDQLHKATASADQEAPVQKTSWSPAKLTELIDKVKRAVATEDEFSHQQLATAEQQYIVAEFLQLMHQECHQYPGEWDFSNLQRVLGMMMPLDPNITPKQIQNIVPTTQALFNYLKRRDLISMDQYKVGLKAIANMQPSQNMLATLSRKDRETQLMLSFISSNGVNTDDVKTAEKWMDDHREEVAGFMRSILNPWSEYEHAQLVKHQQAAQQRQLAAANAPVGNKRHAPRGIKFSKKARKKHRRRK